MTLHNRFPDTTFFKSPGRSTVGDNAEVESIVSGVLSSASTSTTSSSSSPAASLGFLTTGAP